jgi:hypothetical protein
LPGPDIVRIVRLKINLDSMGGGGSFERLALENKEAQALVN